jgi:menaquinol-cytochrome c reductase iron-sulfur subunit
MTEHRDDSGETAPQGTREAGADEGGQETGPESPGRRRFLARVCVGLGAGCGGLAVPMVGFVVSPLLRKAPVVWRTVGKVADFKIGETHNVSLVDASPLPWAGITANTAAWLRRTGERDFIAFSVNCAHLGCPVRWLPSANLFLCPCHGGVYYADGSVAAGPPPHGLPRYPARVYAHDGELEVQVRADPVPIG